MRYLNIEVALGIAALAILAAELLDVTLPLSFFIVVPLVTWSVYTLDRIIDTKDPTSAPKTGRHQFHLKYRMPLLASAVLGIAVAATTAVLEFPMRYWIAAIPLGLLTVLHLLLQRSRSRALSVVKDANVVLTYTLSAWAIPVVEVWHEDSLMEDVTVWVSGFLAVFFLVLIDVLLLSKIDAKEDQAAGRPSIAVALGAPGTIVAAFTLRVLVGIIAVLVLFEAGFPNVAGVILFMALAYAVLERKNFADPNTARLVLEAVLIIPLILLLF